jgi:hypothetical protein
VAKAKSKYGNLIAPNGNPIVNVAQKAAVWSGIEGVTKKGKSYEFEWSGETDYELLGNETRDGSVVVFDEDGNEFLVSECAFKEEESET